MLSQGGEHRLHSCWQTCLLALFVHSFHKCLLSPVPRVGHREMNKNCFLPWKSSHSWPWEQSWKQITLRKCDQYNNRGLYSSLEGPRQGLLTEEEEEKRRIAAAFPEGTWGQVLSRPPGRAKRPGTLGELQGFPAIGPQSECVSGRIEDLRRQVHRGQVVDSVYSGGTTDQS